MVERRSYSTALRDERTAATRRRILDVAHRAFLERGYLGTTVAAVAAEAGVSVQTLYNLVGGKPALLKAVYDVTLAGDDQPVPLARRPVFQEMIAAPDGRSCLTRYAEIARMLAERIFPLLPVLLAQAATGDADLRAFVATIEGERATGTTSTARHVASLSPLRPGLDERAAADILWTLTAPDLADRLVRQRGWSWDRYQQWLATTMADALLGSPDPAETARPAQRTR